jgi:tRNA U34 5-methylaminomethyl-2-thiouridine-forming methyltransferase MnmC
VESAGTFTFAMAVDEYSLIQLPSGAYSVQARRYAETMHPGIGPMAEAEALYVRQTQLVERLRQHVGEFVIWDVGLGIAANALTVLRQTAMIPATMRIVSFDDTVAPLTFALGHVARLPHLAGYEPEVKSLLAHQEVSAVRGVQRFDWRLVLGDFPSLMSAGSGAFADALPAPHLILFDPYSPARNPAMWTLAVLGNLFRRLEPNRPCLLSTYSRSTITRVTLLLAGFWVGRGEATGWKEETTVAANAPGLMASLLDRRWLERARRSDSAEPLLDSVYRRAPLSDQTWAQLQQHPQFGEALAFKQR